MLCLRVGECAPACASAGRGRSESVCGQARGRARLRAGCVWFCKVRFGAPRQARKMHSLKEKSDPSDVHGTMHYAHCTLHIAHCTLQVRARERVFRNTFPYAYQVFVYILAFAHSYSVSLARRLVASARACLSARPRAHVRLVCEFFLATRFHMRTKCICIYTYLSLIHI